MSYSPRTPHFNVGVLCVSSLGKVLGTVSATTLRWGDGGRKEVSITMPWFVKDSACLDYLSRGRYFIRHVKISIWETPVLQPQLIYFYNVAVAAWRTRTYNIKMILKPPASPLAYNAPEPY